MNNSILSLMPNFTAEAHQLFTILTGITLVMMFLGLIMAVFQAMGERSIHSIKGTLIRLAICSILVGSISAWGNLIADSVNGIVTELGLGTMSGGVYNAYQKAIAQKFGSNGAGQTTTGQPVQTNNGVPIAEGDTSGGFAQPGGSTKITDYAFANDLTPDPNSSAGLGNHGNQLTAYSGSGTSSAALTASAAQLYNVQIGQQFTVQAANGSTYSLTYDDTVPSTYNGVSTGDVIDIYDPNGLLGGNSFSSTATSVTDGTMAANGGNGSFMGGWISKIGDSLMVALLFPLTHMLSLIALGIMWLMQAVQQILFIIEIAVSPIFIGMLAVRGLAGTASRFFSSLVAITLWGLGWAVADMVTTLLINLAINPANNAAATAASPMTGIGLFITLAVWVIGSSFLAPIVITAMLMSGGGSGVSALFGATVGMIAARFASGGAQAVAAGAAAPISAASAAVMGVAPRFARRPQNKAYNDLE